MRIIMASDHAGLELKEHLRFFLAGKGYAVEDKGPFSFDENDDYPDYIASVAEVVSSNPQNTRAIIVGGSGQGEAIVANRFPHVRAVVYVGEPSSSHGTREILTLTRTHNDANILSLGARFISKESAEEIVLLWLTTAFSGEERHVRRIAKIETVTGKKEHESQ
jgi:ribose 5-phosphate isomerase B